MKMLKGDGIEMPCWCCGKPAFLDPEVWIDGPVPPAPNEPLSYWNWRNILQFRHPTMACHYRFWTRAKVPHGS